MRSEFLKKAGSASISLLCLQSPTIIHGLCPLTYQPTEASQDNLNPQYRRFLQTFRYSDEALGSFVKQLRKDNLSENVILFILADHGQPMGEHDQNFMGQKSLYEENMAYSSFDFG